MKKTKLHVHMWVALFFALVVLAGIVFPANYFKAANADTTAYTSVMEDLKSDENFNAADYPADYNDYSLQVIQIAESSDKELFVYVYQPSHLYLDLVATSINIAREAENQTWRNYRLSLLNVQGVFAKYKVEGITVYDEAERYYNITSILREWNPNIDNLSTGASWGNSISEIAYQVGKCYVARTKNGEVQYSCEKTETITITEKYCGYLRYLDGFFLYLSTCDAWYVAFDTDMNIDYLYEADVFYSWRKYTKYYTLGGLVPKTEYESTHEDYVYLSYTDKANHVANGLINTVYTWDRIETVSDFIEHEELTDEAKKNLRGKKWVLRFAETKFEEHKAYSTMMDDYDKGTEVSDVMILRLKFKSGEKTYNLGVVDNKQSVPPGAPPDNVKPQPENPLDGIKDWFENLWDNICNFFNSIGEWFAKLFTFQLDWWVYLIVVVVLLSILAPILSLIFPTFGEFLKRVFSALWDGIKWLVTLPFRGIAALIRKIRGE